MQQFAFPYELSLKTQLPAEAQALLDAAEAAATAASDSRKQRSGASLLLTDGRIMAGARQEREGHPEGLCAARAVLAKHNPEGPEKVRAIAIAWQYDQNDPNPPVGPCGICRQSILELQLHQGSAISVYMSAPDGQVIMVEDACYLLPFYSGSGKYL